MSDSHALDLRRDPPARVLLAIGTRMRPRLLDRCLASVSRLRIPSGLEFRTLVVDNNPGGEAREIRDRWSARTAIPLDYHHVPEQGIVMVRNRALEHALEVGSDAIGFIDDDTVVTPGWLAAGISALSRHPADVVLGPVRMEYPDGAPGWFRALHQVPVRPDGPFPRDDGAGIASTNNVLFRVRLVRDWGLRFLPEFNLGGGEDTCFFEQARDRGAISLWASEAEVVEEVQATRACLGWYLQRRFRQGNAGHFRDLVMGRHRHGIGIALSRLYELLRTVAWKPLRRVLENDLEPPRLADLAGDACEELGAVAACLGYRYLEYTRVHGS